MSARSDVGRVGVWGRSGSGKSSYVKKALKSRKRVVIFDPLDEYAHEGFDRISGPVDGVRLAMRDNWGGFRLAYVPPPGSEARALSVLSRLLMAAQQPYKDGGRGAPVTLVVEEMNMCFPVHGGEAQSPGFAEICSRGRHYGIAVFGVSQRIAEVSTRFRGNCTETVVFAQRGPRDQTAAQSEIGAKVQLPAENLCFVTEKSGKISTGKLSF